MWLLSTYLKTHLNYLGKKCPYLTFFLNLCLSIQKQLKECVELLNGSKQGTLPPGVTDAQVKTESIK